MERVLLNKVSWLVNHGHEVMVVTTDQDGRAPFYHFPESVRMIDLGINYSADNTRPVHIKILNYLRKRRIHRHRLSALLMRERPDITVSLYPSESSFIPDIQDGSKKVLELHFNRYFRILYGRKGLLGLIDKWRSRKDCVVASKFDRFVVLSEEDRGYWGKMYNITVIPNSAVPSSDIKSDCSSQRVIAIGRLDFQKGFDRLLRIWAKVKTDPRFAEWHLDIFGQGEWHDKLLQMAADLDISDSVTINNPVKNISTKYLDSSILAMTSNYEGFPMVMIEAMEMGLPVVSYDFKCGPKDIIIDGHNGILVSNGDEIGFANALSVLMADEDRRKAMGRNALSVIDVYSEEVVMGQWMQLFNNLTKSCL